MRPPRWEYRTIKLDVGGWVTPKVDTAAVDAQLDALGAEGWELVNAFDLNSGHGQTSAIVALFKRTRD